MNDGVTESDGVKDGVTVTDVVYDGDTVTVTVLDDVFVLVGVFDGDAEGGSQSYMKPELASPMLPSAPEPPHQFTERHVKLGSHVCPIAGAIREYPVTLNSRCGLPTVGPIAAVNTVCWPAEMTAGSKLNTDTVTGLPLYDVMRVPVPDAQDGPVDLYTPKSASVAPLVRGVPIQTVPASVSVCQQCGTFRFCQTVMGQTNINE